MKKRRRPRDTTFLGTAALAGAAGLLAVAGGLAISVPALARHQALPPAFLEFTVWGIIALAGCYASLRTYWESGDPPQRPPRGGLPALRLVEGGAASEPPRVERDAA